MESLELELGTNWRDQCFIFSQEDMSTVLAFLILNRGRQKKVECFTLGLSRATSKRIWKVFHAISIELLKPLGAKVYVGSTDTRNVPMRRDF